MSIKLFPAIEQAIDASADKEAAKLAIWTILNKGPIEGKQEELILEIFREYKASSFEQLKPSYRAVRQLHANETMTITYLIQRIGAHKLFPDRILDIKDTLERLIQSEKISEVHIDAMRLHYKINSTGYRLGLDMIG